MIRFYLSIGLFILAGSALTGQSKEELQRQKERAFEEIKLARELMEKTTAQRESRPYAFDRTAATSSISVMLR